MKKIEQVGQSARDLRRNFQDDESEACFASLFF